MYGQERNAIIKMENGIRALNVARLNPGSVKAEQARRDIIKNLARNKIHIAAIQETRITKDRDYIMGNYRVLTEAATEKDKTGVVQGDTNYDT